MNEQPQSETQNSEFEESLRLHASLATFATVILFGYLLLAGGIVEIVNPFLAETWRGFFLNLLGGILHLVLGGFIFDKPDRAADDLILVLAVAFLVGGMFRIAGAMTRPLASWMWIFYNGPVALALCVHIGRQWDSAYRFFGLFAGIGVVFNHLSWIMLESMVRVVAPRPLSSESKAPAEAAVLVR